MAEFYYYRQFEKDGLAINGSFEDTWTAEENLVIDRIYIKNKSGAELDKSTFYLKISERVYSHPYVFASVLGPDKLVSDNLNIPWNLGEVLSFVFKNLEGAEIDVGIVLKISKP